MFLLRLLVVAALPAAAVAAETVREIAVEGNSRTSREVILRALDVHPGDALEDEALPALRQRVYNLRLFRAVEVEKRPTGAGVVLAVSVEERWTLIPIPFLGASEGSVRAGLALFESNLLGRHKQLGLMGAYSSTGSAGRVLYRDPAVLGSRAVLAVDLVAEDVEREQADGFDVIYAWRDRRLEASVRPGVRLGRSLTVRAGPFALLRESRAEAGYAAPPRAGRDLGLAADLELSGQDYRGWFDAGPLLRAYLRRSLPALGSDRAFTQASAVGAWSLAALRDHAASATLSGFVADGDPVLDAFTLGGRPGSRGLREAGLWAERAITATLDYQVPFWRPGWGTATALGFVDLGLASWRGDRTRWVAPGAGFRVYFRNLALPAMGLDLAWSSVGRSVAPSFFLGFGA